MNADWHERALTAVVPFKQRRNNEMVHNFYLNKMFYRK